MKKQLTYLETKVVVVLYFLSLSIYLPAQVCYGTYGSPVWVSNFGNANPGVSLPPGRTSCLFTSNNCPTEGYYTIIDSVPGCFTNSWQSMQAIPVNGNMMLVNAPIIPGDIYVDTVENLCDKINFQFFASILNVSLPSSCGGHPLKPRLSFTVETLSGVVLGVYSSGNIDAGIPTVFLVYFRNPEGNHAVRIRITDTAPGGCGNDFTLDDIGLSACGPVIDVGIVNALSAAIDVCVGSTSSTTVYAKVSGGYTHPSYQWQQYNGTTWIDIYGATSLSYIHTNNTQPGVFKYRLAVAEGDNILSAHCRVFSDEATINIHISTVIGIASSNSPVCEHSKLNLFATGGISYQWRGPAAFNSTDANPSFTATNTSAGQYTVTVGDALGCQSTATTTVSLIAAPILTVSDTKNICLGNSVALQVNGANSYMWMPANTLSDAVSAYPIAKPVTTTTYKVIGSDSNHCTNSANVLVTVNSTPIVNAGKDKVTIKGQPVILDGNIIDTSNVDFSWLTSPSLSNIYSLHPIVKPVVSTGYILTATSRIGCGTAYDTVLVKVYNGLYIPNAFTPNLDGLNDTWHIPAIQAFPNASISVYNRYGIKIFESSGADKDWDGNYKNLSQPAGAYPYIIDLKNNSPVIKGTVMIIK